MSSVCLCDGIRHIRLFNSTIAVLPYFFLILGVFGRLAAAAAAAHSEYGIVRAGCGCSQ